MAPARMPAPCVICISECFIKPKYEAQGSSQSILLAPWDLSMLSSHHIQKGLLFTKPSSAKGGGAEAQDPTDQAHLSKLKDSLSLALVHFYPLAGQLSTQVNEEDHSCLVTIDCSKGPGARFIHATLGMTTNDILSSTYVPRIVHSLFDHDRAVNHDGHTMPLLSVQVTELIDGVFIGCSMNHIVGDGTSFWHFMSMWSEIYQAANGKDILSISRPPIHQRVFLDGYGPIINLPFASPEEFVSRFEAPELRERFFHFSSESIAKLKAKANAECNTKEISSLQALSALVWRCITRARHLPKSQETGCKMAVNERQRLDPPLSRDYFGNAIQAAKGVSTAGELLEQSLGWAAMLLHKAVIEHTDKTVRDFWKAWMQSPLIYQIGQFFDPNSIMIGSSPRFDMYGNEFGMGKAIAVRNGYAHKFDGKVISYPGPEGGGSVDLEICLSPDSMTALERDQEFVATVTSSYPLYYC